MHRDTLKERIKFLMSYLTEDELEREVEDRLQEINRLQETNRPLPLSRDAFIEALTEITEAVVSHKKREETETEEVSEEVERQRLLDEAERLDVPYVRDDFQIDTIRRYIRNHLAGRRPWEDE